MKLLYSEKIRVFLIWQKDDAMDELQSVFDHYSQQTFFHNFLCNLTTTSRPNDYQVQTANDCGMMETVATYNIYLTGNTHTFFYNLDSTLSSSGRRKIEDISEIGNADFYIVNPSQN